MLFKANFHTHTCFDDGADTPEDIVRAAIDTGFKAIGFSVHSYLPFESDWVLKRADEERYLAEIERLKKEYADRISIFNGIELDYFSGQDPTQYDYIIGSVHCIEKDGAFFDVDDCEEVISEACKKYYHGDWYALTEDYYALVGEVADKTYCDIIGHFDLVTKLNEGGKLFDTADARYRKAWKKAADSLLGTGKPFEVNTGAMARGYRTEPYPSFEIFSYLSENGAKFILTSDCHAKEKLTFGFEETAERYGVTETLPPAFRD